MLIISRNTPPSRSQMTPPPELRNYSAFTHRARTLRDLINQFEDQEARDLNDVTLDLKSLQMNQLGNVQVPTLGMEFALTDWSKRQVANLVGVKWDRWFEHAAPEEQADEINRRFGRYDQQVKLRLTRQAEPGVQADGTLKAFVSPGFTAIPDSRIARMMLLAMQSIDEECRIIRADITDRTVSYVISVGQPYAIGGPGEVGDVWGGILLRNSGVGYSSLQIVLHLTRLVCRNGMTAPLRNAELLRRKHTKGIADDALFDQLGERLLEVPGQLRHSGQIMLTANQTPVPNPEEEVASILSYSKLPKRMIEPIMAAYQIEPRANRFGVISAITKAAQGFSPEERLLMEQAASTYLMEH